MEFASLDSDESLHRRDSLSSLDSSLSSSSLSSDVSSVSFEPVLASWYC